MQQDVVLSATSKVNRPKSLAHVVLSRQVHQHHNLGEAHGKQR